MKWYSLRLICLLLTLLSPIPISAQSEESDSREPEVEPAEPTVKVDAFGVRVQPQLEFIVPYGVISQRADIALGGSVISTRADFDLASSAVAGEVGLSRRFGNWEPGIRGYQRSNSEGIAQPRVTGGELRILPDERFLERERGVVGELDWYIREEVIGIGSIEFVESIETALSRTAEGTELQQESFEIVPSLSAELRSLQIERPRRSADIVGTYLRFTLSQRFVDRFTNPVALEGRIATLLNQDPHPRLTLEHQVSATTPLHIWDQGLYRPLTVGGFDTLRGFENGEVSETRGVLTRNTVTWDALPGAELSVDSPVVNDNGGTVEVRFHNFRALFAADTLLAQEEPALDSEVKGYLGSGPGLALTVSAGESVHFDLRAYVSWGVGRLEPPIFYLQGSVFSISTG